MIFYLFFIVRVCLLNLKCKIWTNIRNVQIGIIKKIYILKTTIWHCPLLKLLKWKDDVIKKLFQLRRVIMLLYSQKNGGWKLHVRWCLLVTNFSNFPELLSDQQNFAPHYTKYFMSLIGESRINYLPVYIWLFTKGRVLLTLLWIKVFITFFFIIILNSIVDYLLCFFLTQKIY